MSRARTPPPASGRRRAADGVAVPRSSPLDESKKENCRAMPFRVLSIVLIVLASKNPSRIRSP